MSKNILSLLKSGVIPVGVGDDFRLYHQVNGAHRFLLVETFELYSGQFGKHKLPFTLFKTGVASDIPMSKACLKMISKNI